jgi:hypothetical protein
MTPKAHPEIAGVGIECSWGYVNLKYRKEINDGLAEHLEENVKRALAFKAYRCALDSDYTFIRTA